MSKVVQVLDENDSTQLSLLPELLGEVMLCLKESNKRARGAAFDLIVCMAKKMDNAGRINSSGDANLAEFIKMVLGGLAGTTPHMRSASVLALARLVFEYKTNETLLEVAPTILKLALMLLHEKSREVIKSVLGFTKVMISALDVESLRPFLADICAGILEWSGDTKNRFRQKIRHILERLVKKFDYNTVLSHVPEADVKLMSHIKKTKERALKKKNKKDGKEEDVKMPNNVSSGTAAAAVGLGKGNSKFQMDVDGEETLDGDIEDAEEEKNEMKWVNATKKAISKNGAWLHKDDENPLNLLDGESVAHKIMYSNPNSSKKRIHSEITPSFDVNEEGKMIINDSEDEVHYHKYITAINILLP